jgi:hypothetical protein
MGSYAARIQVNVSVFVIGDHVVIIESISAYTITAEQIW